ncbi:exported hypothetical protein [Candidatus Propionivibrio aalborgensis]|uniref:Uncharacterized protein n=1 Tax=Candidatus Propionivibrio aalborgensis TaxID=1860101 RepID=A0A1A8XHL8_9RHOO|nr:exported hypothetical protein [Candidatus Propionivibrio aalborgensis]
MRRTVAPPSALPPTSFARDTPQALARIAVTGLRGLLEETSKVFLKPVVNEVVSYQFTTKDGPAERCEASKREPRDNLDQEIQNGPIHQHQHRITQCTAQPEHVAKLVNDCAATPFFRFAHQQRQGRRCRSGDRRSLHLADKRCKSGGAKCE